MIECLNLKTREEWLAKRTSFIGGSEAASLVGMNPYLSNVELWEIKTGRRKREDISGKPYVQYGNQAEALLRDLFKLDFPQYEVEYIPNNMWRNSEYPFAHASLDGWLTERETGRKGILEIKTTNILQSMQREKWNKRIPSNYYIQVLHYLFVTGFDFAVLHAQLRFDYSEEVVFHRRTYFIEREEVEEDIDILIQEERKFADAVKKDIRPALILPTI